MSIRINPVKIAAFAFTLLAVQTARADWDYDVSTDAMTGKATKTAFVRSSKSLDLPFPHQGKNYGQLTVRQHPKYGLDVIYSVDKGQIMCSQHSGCNIQVRFDEAQPVTFTGSEPADRDSKVVFLQNPKRFIASASKAKRILVQVNLYRNGAPVTEFHSQQPLKWPINSK